MVAVGAGFGLAYGQTTADDLMALREQGRKEGWTFQVGETSASRRPNSALCGAVEPADWQAKAHFEAAPKGLTPLPAAFDWRTQAGYPGIKDQGNCGSCWAFATVAPLEWEIRVKDGVDVDLSEQWLICCIWEGWNCTVAGWAAHDYHQDKLGQCGHSGAVLEACYPYTAANCTSCTCTNATNHVYHIKSWAYLGTSNSPPDVPSIKQAILDHGPVVVCVVGSSVPFKNYVGGIFNYDTNATTDHMVALVGWDDNQAGGVWFVRNSWGTDWGESGYMRIKYGYSKIGTGANYINYGGANALQVIPSYGFDSYGLLGGPFTPATMIYTLTNQGANNVFWDVLSTPSWLTLGINWGGTLAPGGSMTVTATVSSAACSLGPGRYTGVINIINEGDLHTNSLPVSLTVGCQAFYTNLLDTKPKWTAEGEWAFGQPTGGGAAIFGFADPTSGYTGTNVWGVNLNGDYSLTNVPSPWYYLTTGPYDFRGYTSTMLQFERWLNCRPATIFAANVTIDVSTNYPNHLLWTTIWSNVRNSDGIYDAYWTNAQYTFPAWADNCRYVYVRWGYRVPDNVWCSGWNIDDIEFQGIPLPVIINQPASHTSDACTTATFAVTAGGLGPLSYQWVKYGTNYLTDGGKISGATNSTLTISNVLKADQGNYSVIITNVADGVVTSSSATLTVNDPLITSQPASCTNLAGTTATFSVSAAGTTPLGYQWVSNGTNYLADTNNVSGAKSTTLTLTNVAQSDAASYSVIVTNPAGSVSSSAAMFTVLAPPAITTQPQSRTNDYGTTGTFTVAASGTGPLAYQWRKGGTDLPSGTDALLALPNVGRCNAGVYAVLVTNLVGSTLSSNALLVVRVPQRLGTPTLLSDGTCVILSGDADGGLLSTNDLANFDLYASTNLENWVRLTNRLSVTNGQLRVCDPGSANLPQRFYRVDEQ